jgi:hypothetical protein
MTEREQRPKQGQQSQQPKQTPAEDPAVGHVTEGPRDYYGRPLGEAETDKQIQGGADQPKDAGAQQTGGTEQQAGVADDDSGASTETRPDTRAADETLGGYGGVAGGKDERPEQQRKRGGA